MKTALSISFLVLLFSCGQKDEKFCSCMEVSNKLNEKTNQGLINSILTKTDIKQIHTLQNQKDSICNDFKNISGEEALNLKKKCEK